MFRTPFLTSSVKIRPVVSHNAIGLGFQLLGSKGQCNKVSKLRKNELLIPFTFCLHLQLSLLNNFACDIFAKEMKKKMFKSWCYNHTCKFGNKSKTRTYYFNNLLPTTLLLRSNPLDWWYDRRRSKLSKKVSSRIRYFPISMSIALMIEITHSSIITDVVGYN